VTDDEKWIYFDNPKREKSWVDPGQLASTPKRNIHVHKTLLCICGDQEGMLNCKLLCPNKTVTADRYQQQLCRLSDEFTQERLSVANNRRKVILLHDNARTHVAKGVKQTLLQLEWKFSRIQHTLLTWHHRTIITISFDRCNTHLRTHTSPVTKKWVQK